MATSRGAGFLGATLLLAGCLTFGSSDNGTSSFDPAAAQSYLQRNFAHTIYLLDAVSRVVQAANGGHPAGVTFTPTATGASGSVTIDLKGDGTDIAMVNATLTYDNAALGISGGATLSVTSIVAGSATGTGNAHVAVTGGGTSVQLSNASASLQPTTRPSLTISDGNVTITPSLSNPTVLGSANFATDGKSGTAFFESNGSGGWRIRVTSSDFAGFTVP